MDRPTTLRSPPIVRLPERVREEDRRRSRRQILVRQEEAAEHGPQLERLTESRSGLHHATRSGSAPARAVPADGVVEA